MLDGGFRTNKLQAKGGLAFDENGAVRVGSCIMQPSLRLRGVSEHECHDAWRHTCCNLIKFYWKAKIEKTGKY